MSIFKNLFDRIRYYFDSRRVLALGATVENFDYDSRKNSMVVFYRLGRQKLVHKMALFEFGEYFFEKVSLYDQLRMTKFLTLQNLIQASQNLSERNFIVNYTMELLKNDRLF